MTRLTQEQVRAALDQVDWAIQAAEVCVAGNLKLDIAVLRTVLDYVKALEAALKEIADLADPERLVVMKPCSITGLRDDEAIRRNYKWALNRARTCLQDSRGSSASVGDQQEPQLTPETTLECSLGKCKPYFSCVCRVADSSEYQRARAKALEAERDAARADTARLREALERITKMMASWLENKYGSSWRSHLPRWRDHLHYVELLLFDAVFLGEAALAPGAGAEAARKLRALDEIIAAGNNMALLLSMPADYPAPESIERWKKAIDAAQETKV